MCIYMYIENGYMVMLWIIYTPYIISKLGNICCIYKYMSVLASRVALPLVTLEDHYIFRLARASSYTHLVTPSPHPVFILALAPRKRYCDHLESGPRAELRIPSQFSKQMLSSSLLHCCWTVQLLG